MLNLIRYRLEDINGTILFCNLRDPEKEKCITLSAGTSKSDNLRFGLFENDGYRLYSFSNDKDVVQSANKFRTISLSILASTNHIENIFKKIEEEKRKDNKRLIHNLTSINAHCIQEVYAIIDQNDISGNIYDQVRKIKGNISNNAETVAKALIRIAKYNAAMKNEFSVFKKISSQKAVEISPKFHVVHKVFLNVLHLYFSDFADKGVDVVIHPSTSKAFFDYETIHVAIYHLIENSAKYTKPDTPFTITITEESGFISIYLDMISLFIAPEEELKIFSEEYSGIEAKSSKKNGDGLGLSLVKHIIELNQGNISYERGGDKIYFHDNNKYQINRFKISLKNNNK